MLHRRHHWFAVLVLALLGALTFLPSFSAQAQSKTLRWHRWDADIQINADGTFTVQEVYEIEFIGGPFTFGYRNIPIDQFEELTDFAVREGSVVYQQARTEQPNTFYVTENGGEYVVNWFFPSTVNQTRVFTVQYTVVGGIIINSEVGERFFWKAVGPDHDFPIETSTVIVRMPPGEQIDTSIDPFYYGVDAQATVAPDLGSVTYQVNYIPADQYFEVGVRFPHGIVPNAVPSWQAAYEEEQNYNDRVRPMLNLGLGGLGFLILLGGLGGVYLMWLFSGRDPDVGPVPSYLTEPPSDLPPGLAGTLVDEKADLQDIIATVVDLARRGVIEMEEHESKFLGITASRDFTFRKLPDTGAALRQYEQDLLREMFGRRDEIDLEDLRNKFYSAVPKLQREMYEDSVKEGLFPASPKAIRSRYLALGIAGLVVSVGLGFCGATLSDRVDAILCPFAALGLASVALLVISGSMPVKTRPGAEAAAKWRAFKSYLSNAERFADLKEVTDQFEKYLPYAIAFGLERTWINKFARVPNTPMPGWYIPTGGRGYYGGMGTAGEEAGKMGKELGGGMRDLRGDAVRPAPSLDNMSGRMMGGLSSMSAGLMTMLNSTASTFTSVPQSSSSGGGFSGGGFSGGGFSGGGGGGGGGAGFG